MPCMLLCTIVTDSMSVKILQKVNKYVCICMYVHMYVWILHSLLLWRWSTVLFQVTSTVPWRKSCPQTAEHNINNHNKPDIASASPVADQLCRTHYTVSYTLQLFVCPINDLAQIKVSFSGDYTATRSYSTSVDLSAPNCFQTQLCSSKNVCRCNQRW